jgi:hypothetical protein
MVCAIVGRRAAAPIGFVPNRDNRPAAPALVSGRRHTSSRLAIINPGSVSVVVGRVVLAVLIVSVAGDVGKRHLRCT